MDDTQQDKILARRDTVKPSESGIMALRAIANSGNESFRDLVRALKVISDHAHIRVDIGEGGLDAEVYALKGKMDGLTGAIFPYLNKTDASAPYEYRKGEEAWEENLAARLSQQDIPALKERYQDFPALVAALDCIDNAIKQHGDLKELFRKNLEPGDMAALSDAYDRTFRTTAAVHVKRSDVANAAEGIALQRAIASVTPQKMLGGGRSE